MHTHALTAAMTLYESGTLTLSQAATRAGRSEAELVTALHRHNIDVREETGSVVAATERRVGAD